MKDNKYKFPITEVEKHFVKNVLVGYSDHLENAGHVSVTSWANGEGYDISLNEFNFQITHSQWMALKKAFKEIFKEENWANEVSR